MKIKDTRGAVLTALKYAALTIGALILFFPFIYMVLSSLKTAYESTAIPPIWLPAKPQWENYAYAWNLKPFLLYYRNTLAVCAISVAGTLLFSILGAYAFTIYEFPFKNVLFILFMLTMMVPEEMLIIQNYETIADLGLLDTFLGIALPSLANGFYIFMLREYVTQMPPALFKSAKVDCCPDFKFLWKVVIPMNKNAIATIAILSFIGQWNAFMWPNMVTRSDEHRVITSGLMTFRNMASANYHYLMAAACITVIPMVIFYVIFHKQIISGVANGGIKG